MRAGNGYYPAMSDALTAKEGVGPSQIRSVRPPTLYLFLAQFRPGSWRYLDGFVYLATLLLAWRLARALHPLGGPIAVFLTGFWVLGAASYLFLHTELWGVPLLLGGALALRNERWAAAAVALGAAALLRGLYLLPLLIGMVLAPRRRALSGRSSPFPSWAWSTPAWPRRSCPRAGRNPPWGSAVTVRPTS